MSEFSTPLPSGMRVRDIQKRVAGKDPQTGKDIVVPVLDAKGQEIEVWAVDVPLHIEAVDGTKEERRAVIDGFVADIKTKGADLALVRADALIAGTDPTVAETAFTAAQATAVAEATPTSPGGLS